MSAHQDNLQREAALKSSTARLSIYAAAFLIALKTGAGWMTASISVWASLLDSVMDIFASSLNYLAVRISARPADEDHLYGHGKVESLAGLFQALVIGLSGIFLISEAIHRIRVPHPTESEAIGIASMVIAIIVSIALVIRLRRVGRQTDSPALTSDAVHYATDVYINLGVLGALMVTIFTGWRLVDPLVSIAIAIYILWSAAHVAYEAINVLMDRRLPADVDETVATVVSRYESQGVLGFHDLRTRRSGSHRFVDLHLEVLRTKGFEEAHDLTVQVIRAIEAELPRTRVQIHTDPAG
ncbi:MAG TPA: cation diffusion facilitator family transporter [Pyrinomonadaceae bacterium]|nr:cation diffusion facilitator family transporter [Pyrinomonadaceae bacterium]